MRTNLRAGLRGALGLLVVLAATGAAASARAGGSPPPRALTTARPGAAGGEAELRFALALTAARSDRPREVVLELEGVEFGSRPAFADAERAAWLLAQAYLALGDMDRFDRLGSAVGSWPAPGAWARALLAERTLVAAGPGAKDAARALGLSRLAADAEGAARWNAAAGALARGQDPGSELARVPGASAFARTAADLAARWRWERGDRAGADSALAGLAGSGVAAREADARLADDALESGAAAAAWERYRALDAAWLGEHAGLIALRTAPDRTLDSLLAAWERSPAATGAPPLAVGALAESARRLVRAAADDGQPGDAASILDRPADGPPDEVSPAPTDGDWRGVSESGARAAQARAASSRAALAAEGERAHRDEWSAYLAVGRAAVSAEREEAEARLARLEALRHGLDSLDARLRAVRDSASARAVERAGRLLAECDADERWIAGMRHFWCDGPSPLRAPAGAVGPDSVLAGERRLLLGIAALAESVAARAPAKIADSYWRAWRPGVLGRVASEDVDARRQRARALEIGASLDSSLAEVAKGATLKGLEARAASFARRADSLADADARLRAGVARRTVERALAGMEREREGIDYGLAASAWARATALDGGGGAAVDSAAGESSEAARWRDEAVARLRTFLARHPAAASRADARFRLADLLEQRARADFRIAMQEHVRRPGAALPVLDTGPAIAIHRAILREDPSFAHRDAVLYDLGCLLAERGEPEATRWFRELLAVSPSSPYAQESRLRLADDAFDAGRFAEATPLYRAAAAGGDTTLRVIALYKLGWTELHADRFGPAADAFGAVLDLDGAGHVDARLRLDDDAEALFVSALAHDGGAPAFAAWFDRCGPRPYELPLLCALGDHFRRYAMPERAVAADRLLLDRFAAAPEALEAARRMDATFRRWNRPQERDAALLADADRFVHGSAWWNAQSADSLRSAGDAFARGALMEVADERHRAARAGGGEPAWLEAARLEERALATFPLDPERRRIELQACEARAALDDAPAALAHAAAAADGDDSLAAAAALARVGVLDGWYERTRRAAGGARGSDSLAQAVLAAGDTLLARFPGEPHGADVRWRQGQLAFAHGWYESAAGAFAALVRERPADPRVPRAATLRADAFVRESRFADARGAYEQALALARQARADTLARRIALAIPACAYRDAEALSAADTAANAANAARFAEVARRWPEFEHADLALYRAGLAWFRAGRTAEGARAMATLVESHPGSGLARDAGRATAGAWEAAGDTAAAARAWHEFSARYRGERQAEDAALRAAAWYDRSGSPVRADSLRLAWVGRHPDDAETAMSLLEPVVARALDSVGVARPVSRWLARPAARRGPAPRSVVADYLMRAKLHPDLASPALLARIEFLRAEEASAAGARVALRQPLARSIGLRRRWLDQLLEHYRAAAAYGVDEWTHAAACRTGEALTAFGDALEASERPADLAGADRQAYDEVIHRQSEVFYARARAVWTGALKGRAAEDDDTWLGRARAALEPRAALRQATPADAGAPASPAGRRQTP